MVGQYPRFRSHVRKGKDGRVYVYYYYDMRPEGKPDIKLGKDREAALREWDRIHNHKPAIRGTLLEAMERWEAEILPGYTSAETKKGYAKNLRQLKDKLGKATWGGVTMKVLKEYLKKRTAKTQANRELALLSVIWNWAITEDLTKLPYPAAGLKRAKWKNKENPRQFEVTDALFAAVYEQADQTLRDCMDIASATGLRLNDCRLVPLPSASTLSVSASKTGKRVEFSVSASPVLSALVERRKAYKAAHLMLLSTPTGKRVSYGMLRDRWDEARKKAAEAHPELAADIKKMFLRDMRKRAADLAADTDEASKLLQHSSKRLTEQHYRTRADKLKPVR